MHMRIDHDPDLLRMCGDGCLRRPVRLCRYTAGRPLQMLPDPLPEQPPMSAAFELYTKLKQTSNDEER